VLTAVIGAALFVTVVALIAFGLGSIVGRRASVVGLAAVPGAGDLGGRPLKSRPVHRKIGHNIHLPHKSSQAPLAS
jgi:hypothetical protein